jgi:hypothetical protein
MKPIEQSLSDLYSRLELFELQLAGLKNELRPLVFPEVFADDVGLGWEIYTWGEWEPVVSTLRRNDCLVFDLGSRTIEVQSHRTVVARQIPELAGVVR